jgi:hypothetical protein
MKPTNAQLHHVWNPHTVKPVEVDHQLFLKQWSVYTNVSQNIFHTRILFPANYLLVHIEIVQHINGDSCGQKKNILIYLHNH